MADLSVHRLQDGLGNEGEGNGNGVGDVSTDAAHESDSNSLIQQVTRSRVQWVKLFIMWGLTALFL